MKNEEFDIDERFDLFFNGRLKQVFIYITDLCQLRCTHCLYKTTLADREMEYEQTIKLLRIFKQYGAKKLTLLGGEPTLWGNGDNYNKLIDLLIYAKEIGYEYIRIDTNGQFNSSFIKKLNPDFVDDLAFSLDGHISQINDKLRKSGSFEKSLNSIKAAVNKKIYSTITTCVHPNNVNYLHEMISLAIDLGVKQINFHPMFKMGIERDSFTGNTHIKVIEWLKVYDDIRLAINKNKYNIEIRISKRFVRIEEYNSNKKLYSFCPQKLGERILIHPNGELRICALTIGSKYHIAKYTKNKITWSNGSSEIENCTDNYICNIQKNIFGEYVPLCISFKPYQNEYVWKTENFDSHYSK